MARWTCGTTWVSKGRGLQEAGRGLQGANQGGEPSWRGETPCWTESVLEPNLMEEAGSVGPNLVREAESVSPIRGRQDAPQVSGQTEEPRKFLVWCERVWEGQNLCIPVSRRHKPRNSV